MKRKIYIEPETLEKAEQNTREAFQAAHDAIENGTPDEIRAAVADLIQKSAAQRAFIRANYNL